VSDLTIAHIVVARHPDGSTVGDQLATGHGLRKSVEDRGVCQPDRVGFILTTATDSVHDTNDDGSLDARKPPAFLKCPFTHSLLIGPSLKHPNAFAKRILQIASAAVLPGG
jgi:hypothetical protein